MCLRAKARFSNAESLLTYNNSNDGGVVGLIHEFTGRRVVIAGACQTPGPICAQRLAKARARVVALDQNAAGLSDVVAGSSARIESLLLGADVPAALRRIGQSWAKAPLHGVLNLLPLAHPREIDAQITRLTALTRAFALGLEAGEGALVTLATHPTDPFDLRAAAMGPALGAAHQALAKVLALRGVQINLVIAPQDDPERGLAAALSLLCREAKDLTGQVIHIAAK